MPGQVFEIIINDSHVEKIFKEVGNTCNSFYAPFFHEDARYYFSKNDSLTVGELSSESFIVNVGKHGGAERKSINNLRNLKAIRYGDKSKTTARSFALENEYEDVYFENKLLPFGWLKFENTERKTSVKSQVSYSVPVQTTPEWSMHNIAKTLGVSVGEVIHFASNSNIPLKKLTSDTVLKEPQAKGIINKMKKHLENSKNSG